MAGEMDENRKRAMMRDAGVSEETPPEETPEKGATDNSRTMETVNTFIGIDFNKPLTPEEIQASIATQGLLKGMVEQYQNQKGAGAEKQPTPPTA